MIASTLSAIVIITLASGLALALVQARRWRAGRAADVDLIAGLKALPRRYLVDVHDVVGRNPFNSRFHALTAGGFLASLVLSCCWRFQGFGTGRSGDCSALPSRPCWRAA